MTDLTPRLAHLAFELLFSATASFLLTSALLPFFSVHATTLTVLRVTGACTLVVFAGLEVLCRVYDGRTQRNRNDNPEFKLNPRGLRELEGGRSPEKREIMHT
ncbi:hypothetical protein K438DRAFT_1982287 [Mycena galopus ATCC 62051]|nr:hypothetical protein K438DRAFT_1982287 [Mycena galopus ATCC 62051]